MTGRAGRKLIDLTHRVDEASPPFPGDPPLEFRALAWADEPSRPGEPRVCSSWMGSSLHLGTHMDAPLHFFLGSRTIDETVLEECMGPAVLVRLRELRAAARIEVQHLEPFEALVRETRRLVIDTGWHERWGMEGYFTDHPVLTHESSSWIVERGVRLVGVDFPSVDRPPHDAHVKLLGSGLLIVENLTGLAAVPQGRFEIACFPLKLGGRDGSPVRAVAWLPGES